MWWKGVAGIEWYGILNGENEKQGGDTAQKQDIDKNMGLN